MNFILELHSDTTTFTNNHVIYTVMKVYIQNFKNIRYVEFELSTVNVLIGPPSSGKTNILEALYLYGFKTRYKLLENKEYFYDIEQHIMENMYKDIKNIFYRKDVRERPKILIKGYSTLEVYYEPGNAPFNGALNNKPLNDFLELDGSKYPLTILYREPYRTYLNRPGGEYLYPDFSNIYYILVREYPDILEHLEKTLNNLYNIYLSRLPDPPEVRFIDARLKIASTLEELSRSIKDYVLYTTAILSNEYVQKEHNAQPIVLLDNMDAYLHPRLIQEFVETLRHVRNVCVVLTTNNEDTLQMIVSNVPRTHVKILGVLRNVNGCTEVVELNRNKILGLTIEYGMSIIRNLEYYVQDLL